VPHAKPPRRYIPLTSLSMALALLSVALFGDASRAEPLTQGGYTTNATVSPATVATGATASISATVTSGPAHRIGACLSGAE
jgi:hypothetical protein